MVLMTYLYLNINNAKFWDERLLGSVHAAGCRTFRYYTGFSAALYFLAHNDVLNVRTKGM